MASTDAGRFVWYEHITRDVPAAIAFYGEVAGWKTQPFGDGHYTMWVGSQGPLGGIIQLSPELEKRGVPPHWMAHVAVEDVDATAAQAKKMGANLVHEPTDIPTVGRFAVIADPQGAVLSVFTPKGGPMQLHDPSKEGEFCWNELMTSDGAAGWTFYSALFGWRVFQDLDMGPMGTYRIYGAGETGLGGMMTKPPGAPMPPMWIYYLSTSDLDATIARATRKGARVVFGPETVPGGGRIAQLTDPQGALFALHQAPAK